MKMIAMLLLGIWIGGTAGFITGLIRGSDI